MAGSSSWESIITVISFVRVMGKMVTSRKPYCRSLVCAFVSHLNLAVFAGWWIAIWELWFWYFCNRGRILGDPPPPGGSNPI